MSTIAYILYVPILCCFIILLYLLCQSNAFTCTHVYVICIIIITLIYRQAEKKTDIFKHNSALISLTRYRIYTHTFLIPPQYLSIINIHVNMQALPCVIERVKPSTPRSHVAEIGQQDYGYKHNTSTSNNGSKEQLPKLSPGQPSLEILEQTVGIEEGKDTSCRHVFTCSDWLESDEGNLHRHDEAEEVEGDVGNIDPRGRKGSEGKGREWREGRKCQGEGKERERRDEKRGGERRGKRAS